MRTIKRQAEFTGYIMLKHKECGAAIRLYVGKGWCSLAFQPEQPIPGAFSKINPYSPKLPDWYYPCTCGKATYRLENCERIYGRTVLEKVCDGRCMGATSGACDCSCGGMNHGANHGGM